MKSEGFMPRIESRFRETLAVMQGFVARHPELLILLFFSVLLRLFLADKNSYWLDEIYSVLLYGINHESAADAIKYLGETSVHPPLYQWVLFRWMETFGHSEVATRSLSIMYATLSILFLYLFSNNAFGKRVAVAATLVYSITYSSILYSIETRSYGQTLFLSMLSIYMLQRYLGSLCRDRSWRNVVVNPAFVGFTLCNALLLLTHYYNVVFIAAQATFSVVYIASRPQAGRFSLVSGLAKAGMTYFLQALIFLAAWQSALRNTLEKYLGQRAGAGNTTWEGPTQGPLATYLETAVMGNFNIYTAVLLIIAVFLVIAIVQHSRKIRSRRDCLNVERSWWWLMVVFCAILPFVFYYAVTLLVNAERINPRYFVFATAPTALLLVLVLERIVAAASTIYYSGRSISRGYVRNGALFAILIALVFAGPGAYRAAIYQKQDWRGIGKQVVELVQGDPKHDYLVYETSFRDAATLDYYLERFSGGEVRTHANMTRNDERRKKFRFRKDIKAMKRADYLVIVFTHHRERQFRETLRALSKEFQLVRRQLDEQGRGYIVYGQK